MLFDVTRGYAIYRYFRGLAFFKVNFVAARCFVGPAFLAQRMRQAHSLKLIELRDCMSAT